MKKYFFLPLRQLKHFLILSISSLLTCTTPNHQEAIVIFRITFGGFHVVDLYFTVDGFTKLTLMARPAPSTAAPQPFVCVFDE